MRAAFVLGASALLAGCGTRTMGEAILAASAYRPPVAAAAAVADERPFVLLAGDLHTHIAPPDGADVTRGFPETVRRARDEHLDFVVLTPHVPARFYMDEALRKKVLADRRALEEEIASTPHEGVLFVAGAEYTDARWGHVGMSFGDLARTLSDVSVEAARARPEAFFERFVATGGVLTTNHPLVTPLDSIFSVARMDLSFRPYTAPPPYPPEIAAVDALAAAMEVYNVRVTELRDRFLVGDTDHTIEKALALEDRLIAERRRRMTPVGGSDSHGHYLRATMFVLAREKSEGAIREAILSGRTCVRAPAACSFEARAKGGGAWATVGDAIQATSSVEVRAKGGAAVFLDTKKVVETRPDEIAGVAVDPRRCSVLRAEIGESESAPIYVNCPL